MSSWWWLASWVGGRSKLYAFDNRTYHEKICLSRKKHMHHPWPAEKNRWQSRKRTLKKQSSTCWKPYAPNKKFHGSCSTFQAPKSPNQRYEWKWQSRSKDWQNSRIFRRYWFSSRSCSFSSWPLEEIDPIIFHGLNEPLFSVCLQEYDSPFHALSPSFPRVTLRQHWEPQQQTAWGKNEWIYQWCQACCTLSWRSRGTPNCQSQMLHVGNIYLHFPLNVAIFHLM